MTRILSLPLIVLTVFGLLACGADAQDEPAASAPNFEVLHSGGFLDSGVNTNKKTEVFADESAYQAELASYTAEPPAAVDFSTSKVLLVDMGRRPTGGYAVSVSSVDIERDAATARVTLSRPGPNCATTQASSNPYQFVEIETTGEILVQEELNLQLCDN